MKSPTLKGDEHLFREEFPSVTTAEYIERWEQARRVLENLTPHEREKHWDMRKWCSLTDCGTAACAAGHCGLDPWFRERGFQLNFFRNRIRPYQISRTRGFFGVRGSRFIFWNLTPRSVEQVIKEIDGLLTELRNGVNPQELDPTPDWYYHHIEEDDNDGP